MIFGRNGQQFFEPHKPVGHFDCASGSNVLTWTVFDQSKAKNVYFGTFKTRYGLEAKNKFLCYKALNLSSTSRTFTSPSDKASAYYHNTHWTTFDIQ